MIIETDMRDKLFEVRIATWSDGTTTTTHIKAFDLAHAKRIANRKWRTTRVRPALTVTERSKELNR
jgi:hypothetical protein